MISPRSSGDDESVEIYPSGSRASAFKADGSGFIYYPTGRVAVCVAVIDGRSRYYLYGDDIKSTPLGAVNEHAVGFFLGPADVRLALSKVGGLITDRHGYIVREWRYDLGAHMPPPTGVLEVRLNKSMSFEFLNRGDMRIKFSHEGILHELDAGVRPKRVEPFHDPAWKDDALGATCRELPRIRSTGLEVGPTQGLGRTIYGGECDRDGHNSAGGGPEMRRSRSWGRGGGGGDGGDGDVCSAAARLRKGGKWLGELDVRLQLYAENPLLKRSSLLQAASGRYAEEIVVPGGKTSVSNPTGKATVSGVPLHKVPASRLQDFLEEEVGPEQLVVVLGVRGDDPACGKIQSTAELTNRFLVQRFAAALPGAGGDLGGGTPSGEKYRMVKVNFAEHQATAELYGVKGLPAFLMFQGGRLAWAGTLGGSPVKSAPPNTAAARQRVLLVEPCAKAQMATERALRKFGCSWDLVLNAPQALLRIQVARTNAMASEIGDTGASAGGGEGYGVLMISDALGAPEVIALEKAFHGGGGAGHGSSDSVIVVGLAQMQGDAAAASNAALKAISAGFAEAPDRKRAVLSPHLALVADMAITKPVRSSALKAVFRCFKRRRDEAAAGGLVPGKGGEGGRGGGKRGDGKGGALSMSASCSTLEGGDHSGGMLPSQRRAELSLLPSARRAEISRQYFDNSYLSRRAFEGGGAGAPVPEGAPIPPAPLPDLELNHQQYLDDGGGVERRRKLFGKGAAGSIRSRTTAGLTTFEDDEDSGFGSTRGGGGGGRPSLEHGGGGSSSTSQHSHGGFSRSPQHGGPSPFADTPDYDSEFSDGESLGSMLSGDSPRSRTSVADSEAGQIWGMLSSLDDLVLEVKANKCQCQRLGARLAALKKPMMAVHRGKQTADHAVLSTIKDLVSESQHFMERFLDPEWWRKGAGHKEDSEMFRELTFRLGFLMQAPPGFQKQSQEEDHADRLEDYADLQATLEERLGVTRDERMANEIMEALRRVRIRAANEGRGETPEIDFQSLQFQQQRSLGNGGFGTVSAASLGGVPVAVKKLNNQNVGADLLEDMRRDVQKFYDIQYDFVVRTLGACTVRPNLCVVQERAPTSLFDLLHKNDVMSGGSIPTQEKAAMLYDVARGLQYLHIKRIVHGDLKSTNVLVFENNRLKVSDFGLIALRESQSGYGGGDTVPSAAWTAPEVLDDQDPSVVSDVYSFGVLVHEVLTQRVPFAGKSVAKVITAVVAKGHRPGYLEGEEKAFQPGLVKLADVCWTQDPAARPRGLSTIVTELGHIVNALGGDPRPQPYVQTAGESATSTPLRPSASPSPAGAAARGHMTEKERRIHDLEQELRALKMQASGGGGIGGDMIMSRNLGNQGNMGRRGGGGGTGMVTPSTVQSTEFSGGVKGVAEGQLPRELARFNRLQTLILSNNYLEGLIPPEFGTMSRLRELDLSMNDLTGSIPASLSNASSLERLCLQCNGLVGNAPRKLQKLHNLKVFIVDWGALSDTHPFRKFRKASPPPTEAEIERANSATRKAACERALQSQRAAVVTGTNKSGIPHGYPEGIMGQGGAKPPSRSNSSSGQATPLSATPAEGGGGGGLGFSGGKLRVLMKGGGSSGGSRPQSPLRGGHGGGGGQWANKLPQKLPQQVGELDRSDSGRWSNNTGHFGHEARVRAPTAPYRGEDGIQSKEKAKAEANASAPSKKSKRKSAFGIFKEVVGGDLHPGYTKDSIRKPAGK
eukprot:g8483.t2